MTLSLMFLVLLNLVLPARTQAPGATPMISGRVARGDTGAAVQNALVHLKTPGGVIVGATSSGESGEFAIAFVQDGEYRLVVSSAGLLTTDATPDKPLGVGKPVRIVDGRPVSGIELGVASMLSIEGRVLDQHNQPLPDVSMSLVQVRYASNKVTWVTVSGRAVRTSGDGAYRFADLLPGDYYVLATAGSLNRASSSEPPVLHDKSAPYVPTYFPGSDTRSGARPVRVEIGSSAFNVTFSLVAATLVPLSGRVLNADGQPVPMATLQLFPVEGGEIRGDIGSWVPSNPDGTFIYRAIPAGSYVLQASLGGANQTGNLQLSRDQAGAFRVADPVPHVFGSRLVEVPAHQDGLGGVDVTMRTPITARGRIRFEGGTPSTSASIRIGLAPSDPASGPIGRSPSFAAPYPDWTFELHGLTWTGVIRVGTSAAGAWALKHVWLDGRDITDEPFDFQTADVNGLEVVLTNRLASITGSVTDLNGPVASTIFILHEDVTKRSLPARFVSTTNAMSDGTFKFTGLPAGSYRIIATIPPATYEAEWFRNLYPFATPITVVESEDKKVALTLVRR